MEMNLPNPKAVLANEAFPKGSPRPDLFNPGIDKDTGKQVGKTLERKPLMPNEAHESQALFRFDPNGSEGYPSDSITTAFF